MFTLKKNSLDISFDDLSSWLAVTGYILPRTEGELARFEKLYADYASKHNINEIDFDKVWNDDEQFGQDEDGKVVDFNFEPLRMAARGLEDISEEIKAKMKANQMPNE